LGWLLNPIIADIAVFVVSSVNNAHGVILKPKKDRLTVKGVYSYPKNFWLVFAGLLLGISSTRLAEMPTFVKQGSISVNYVLGLKSVLTR